MDSTYKQERVVAWYVQVEYFLCFFRVGLLSRPEKKKIGHSCIRVRVVKGGFGADRLNIFPDRRGDSREEKIRGHTAMYV